MAMFDIGKRGSGHDRDRPEDELPETAPVAPVAQDWEAPGQAGVRRREAAVIGPSIHIDGTLKGEEDLLIEGHVTGAVQLQDHSLTIGAKGQVEADLYAHNVIVEGTVEGDLYGVERVAIRSSARVRGNITAPRVSLEDGAMFKGAIEMDADAVAAAMGRPSGPATAKATTGTGKGTSTPPGGSASTGASAGSGSGGAGAQEQGAGNGKAAKEQGGEQSGKSGSSDAATGKTTGAGSGS